MTRYEWTTAKDARIMIEVEKVDVVETAYADGWNVDLKKTEKRVTKMTINGKEIAGAKFDYTQDRIEFALPDHPVAAAIIPQEIGARIWAEERAARKTQDEAEDKYEAHYKRVLKALNQ